MFWYENITINWLHRDIKSDNVLINLITLNIKYIDFWLADTEENFFDDVVGNIYMLKFMIKGK